MNLRGEKNMNKTTIAGASLLISAVLLAASGTHAEAAVNLTDITTHWAKENIEKAVGAGFVDGYPDGTFLPDQAISRAEFLTMLTKGRNIMRYPVPGNDEWYAPYVGAMEVE